MPERRAMTTRRLLLICAVHVFVVAALKDSIVDCDLMKSEFETDKKAEREIRNTFTEFPMLVGFSHDPFGPSKLYEERNASGPGENELAGRDPDSKQDLERKRRKRRPEPRSKRGIFHLYNMVHCATGCNPLAYKGYGCFCGFLGSGEAVDGIDRCCKLHDWCYERASCPLFFTYLMPYFWKCYHGQPLCALNNYEIIGVCSQRLCECDKMFAECLARHPCPKHYATCPSTSWRFLNNVFSLFK